MENVLTPAQALILACVQGATEFIPVSSSGHLVLLRPIVGWTDEGGLVFDIVLHAGSLAAILFYFWREWLKVGQGLLQPARMPPFYRRLPWLLLLATLPAAAAAPLLLPFLEDADGARNSLTTGLSMLATGLWFWLCDRHAERRAGAAGRGAGEAAGAVEQFGWRDAFWAGMVQVLALLPGASRSGWTTGAGVLRGYQRAAAVRFAFYMAVPAILGAIVLQARAIFHGPPSAAAPGLMLAGFLVSLAASLLAIRFCLWFFRAHSFRLFRYYMLLTGAAVLAWELML